jgi:hypothetical protein
VAAVVGVIVVYPFLMRSGVIALRIWVGAWSVVLELRFLGLNVYRIRSLATMSVVTKTKVRLVMVMVTTDGY